MVIFKIATVALVAAFCIIAVKEYRSDIALLIGLVAGVIILLVIIDYFGNIFEEVQSMLSSSGVEPSIIKHLFKIVVIGVIAEFAYSVIDDSGQKSLAEKVLFAGKVIITSLNIPLVKQVFDIIGKML